MMIHATWKETVSYVGRDLRNIPYVIIGLATPGSLETIINNTYLNCFHSFCPGGLAPSSYTTATPNPPLCFPSQMSHESPSASYMITPCDEPCEHTRAQGMWVPFLKLSTTQLGTCLLRLLGPCFSVFRGPFSEICPLFLSQTDFRGCNRQFWCEFPPCSSPPSK